MAKILGITLLTAAALGVLGAPWLAPNPGDEQFRDYLYAPPMRVRVVDAEGAWHLPFVYRWRLVDRVMRTFDEDASERLALTWLTAGRLVGLDPDTGQRVQCLFDGKPGVAFHEVPARSDRSREGKPVEQHRRAQHGYHDGVQFDRVRGLRLGVCRSGEGEERRQGQHGERGGCQGSMDAGRDR